MYIIMHNIWTNRVTALKSTAESHDYGDPGMPILILRGVQIFMTPVLFFAYASCVIQNRLERKDLNRGQSTS